MYCRPHHLCVLIALICLLATSSLVSAATLEVGTGGKTGYTTIQAAVDAASDGDTVVLFPGTYRGSGNCDIDLRRKTISLQGTDPADASVVAATILDCQGTVDEPHRGFYAADFSGEISGLTIVNGHASAGGAIYCENSAVVLSHCRLLDNATLPGDAKRASDGGSGGGVYCIGSTLAVVDCLISGNSTGAGLDSREATGGFGGDGAGVFSMDSGVRISDSTIVGNVTGAGGNGLDGGRGGQGAGLYAVRASIERCVIEGNAAGAGGDSTDAFRGTGGQGGAGGGLFCESSVEIVSSLLVGNRSGRGGAGALAGADGQGGGIWCVLGLIGHCTIADNVALQQKTWVLDDTKADVGLGAGVFCSAEMVVTNSILWENAPDQIAGHNCDHVTYCNIEGDACLTGMGNTSADPLFAAPGNWVDASDSGMMAEAGDPDAVWAGADYRLLGASPCIDAGDPEYVAIADEADLEGQPRVSGVAVDLGAYEAQGLTPVYRFVSPRTGKYFYTPSESEKDKVIDQLSHVWTFEGIAYYVYLRAADTDLMPVYRFWSDKTGSHFWTISESERDRLINELSSTWTYEGLAFYAYPEGRQPTGAKPVYRFWSGSVNGHFYTADEAEKQELMETLRDVWVYEGIVWYAPDEPQTDETPDPSDGADGIYEFSGPEDAVSYVLELKAYLDGQGAQLDNSSVAFVLVSGRMQMMMDFDAMTAELTELHTESECLQYSAVVSEMGGTIALPVSLYMYGFFDTSTARGPYGIDPKTLSFPIAAYGSTTDGDDVCTIVGSASLEREKFDVSRTLSLTNFATGGPAAFESLDDSGRLDVDMAGAFQWSGSQQEQLLLDASIRGHVLQLYVTSVQVKTTGLWLGKRVQGDEKGEK